MEIFLSEREKYIDFGQQNIFVIHIINNIT